MGRATQGVRVMNMKEDDRVSAVALVIESSCWTSSGAAAVRSRPQTTPAARDRRRHRTSSSNGAG